MKTNYTCSIKQNKLLDYLVKKTHQNEKQIPSLTKISHDLDMSIASLREQMEIARALGLIEAQLRRVIHNLSNSFTPGFIKSLSYP